MSTIIVLGTAQQSYKVLLQEIHARLAEVASLYTSQQLDEYQFVVPRAPGLLPSIISFRQAESDAAQLQATFERLGDWRINLFAPEMYELKLGIDALSGRLECPTKMKHIAQAQAQAAAWTPRVPVVQYKRPKRIISAAAAV